MPKRRSLENAGTVGDYIDAIYSNNPNSYNPGQPNYFQLVKQRADEIWNSPEIQNWYKTYRKRSLENGGKIDIYF